MKFSRLFTTVLPVITLFSNGFKVHAGKTGKSGRYSQLSSYSYSESNSSKGSKSMNTDALLNSSVAKGKGGRSSKSGKGSGDGYSTSKSTKSSKMASSKASGSGAPQGGIYTGSVKGVSNTSPKGSPLMSNGIAIGWYFFPDLNVWYYYGYNDPYSSENGGPGSTPCFSSTDFPNGVGNKKIKYEYQFESEGGSVESQLSSIESKFASLLNKFLDCPSTRRLESASRRLRLISVDSAPADSIEGSCGTGCYKVEGSMSISVSSDTSQDELCDLSGELVKYTESYESGSINNVSRISINVVEADGNKCYENKDVETPTVGFSQEESSINNSVFPWYYPLVAVVILLVVSVMFIHRRNRSRKYQRLVENARIEGIRKLEEENKRYTFGAGYHKLGALNAVNVHKCSSASCVTCSTTTNSTEFIPLDNVEDWIKRRIKYDLKAKGEELDLDSTFDVDDSEDDIPSPPTEEYPDDEQELQEAINKVSSVVNGGLKKLHE